MIACKLALEKSMGLLDTLEMAAMLTTTVADAVITAWTAKARRTPALHWMFHLVPLRCFQATGFVVSCSHILPAPAISTHTPSGGP